MFVYHGRRAVRLRLLAVCLAALLLLLHPGHRVPVQVGTVAAGGHKDNLINERKNNLMNKCWVHRVTSAWEGTSGGSGHIGAYEC